MGVSDPRRFLAGSLYYLADQTVRLPGDEQARITHTQRRPVLIVSDQNEVHGVNALPATDWPSVLAIPLSSSTSYRTRFDVQVQAGEGNLPKKSWARVPALQIVAKDLLTEWIGQVKPETMDEVNARILDYLGLLSHVPVGDTEK